MKNKILCSIMAFVLGFCFTACSDDVDYGINTTPLLKDGSVVTGSADVTSTSATLHGTVAGLDGQATSAYVTGFYYGLSQDNLSERVVAPSSTSFEVSISGMPGTVYYYQAFVTLQGKVTYKGEVSSLTLTDSKAVTGDYQDLTANSVKLSGQIQQLPANAEVGIVVSGVPGDERVRAGVRIPGVLGTDYSIEALGLVPATTYYYAAYLDLGQGVVYGETKEFTTPAKEFDVDNDLVDLGLSTKWAKCNIGANSETELGALVGFGDLTGYNTSINPEDYASGDIYKSAQDIANKVTDGACTIPTIAEYEELFRCCKVEWIEKEGVGGYQFTGPNGNSIFMPAAGSRIQGNTVGAGNNGQYLSGSVNQSDNRFAMSYYFNVGTTARNTTPVYQALSVRPVSLAKNVPFDKALFTTKWYLDNGQDGKQHVFEGPFTQYGVTDNWNTISNNYPNIEQNIHWEMGTNNGWIGYTYGKDYGYMEFLKDGTFKVHRIAEDGTVTDETGKWSLNLDDKTVTVDIDVIAANTGLPTKKGTLKILTLTADGMQIALPADDTYAYTLNYYSEAKRSVDELINVKLYCGGSDWGGTWGQIVNSIAPTEINGTHKFTYNGSCNGAMVFNLDLEDIYKRYPNTYVRIDTIRCDGNDIKFDAGKFFYGDVEVENDNYRVELFNIWGKGAQNEIVSESPFSTATNVRSDPAFNFAESLEIVYTVFTDAHPEGVYTPNLITINPSWKGTWGMNNGQTITVVYDNYQYKLEGNTNVTINYDAGEIDHSAGSIMTFIQTDNLYQYFPGTTAELNEIYLDGNAVTSWKSNVSKIVNLDADGGGVHHRLELYNCYSMTKDNCAFGTREGDVMAPLGFSKSMKVDLTYKSLYKTPQW